MDSLRLDRLASHIVAWHNSHRWARRITVAHVTSVGYVVLPFAREPAAVAASSAAPALQPVLDSPPTIATSLVAEPTAAPAPSPAAPVAVAEADEPIEVLIDTPDIDLATVLGFGPEAAGAEPLPHGPSETSADAPVDIAFDETWTAAAATALEPPAPQSDAAATAEAATAAQPVPTADPGPGATLRERAMARAQQMTQEAAWDSAAARLPTPGATPDVAPAGAPPRTPPASPAASVLVSAAASSAPAAPASAADLRLIFSEDFIAPLRPAAVAEFALRHGASYAAPGKDGLVRVVKPDPGMVFPVVEQRWLLTAQIDIGGQRTRLLVGAGLTPEVLGARLSRLPRLAMLAGPPLVVAAAAGLWWLWPAAPKATAKSAVPTPAVVVEHAAQASASAPADVEPTLGRIELPSLGPIVDERRRAAAAAAEARAASAATAAIEQAQKPVPPPAVIGPAFAVSTRLLRTRTESEQLAEAMRALLAGSAAPGLQVQALRSGEDWRVVVWPFTEQAQAEKARALLAARGMKVAVIDF